MAKYQKSLESTAALSYASAVQVCWSFMCDIWILIWNSVLHYFLNPFESSVPNCYYDDNCEYNRSMCMCYLSFQSGHEINTNLLEFPNWKLILTRIQRKLASNSKMSTGRLAHLVALLLQCIETRILESICTQCEVIWTCNGSFLCWQESDDMDSNRPSLSDYTTSLYLFYVKLLLELSTRSEHSCLLRKNLDKLNTDLEKRHSPHKLVSFYSSVFLLLLSKEC